MYHKGEDEREHYHKREGVTGEVKLGKDEMRPH